MKFSAVAALAVAALANAQSRSDIPICVLPCLDDAVKKNTQCSTSDYTCICKNFDAIQGSATSCVLKACGQDVALTKVLPATQALCKNAGSGGSSASSSTPASSSASAPSSSAAPSASSQQPSQIAQPSETAEPTETETAEPTGIAELTQPSQQCSKCSSTLVPTHIPTAHSNGTAPVTAGAAGVVPVGGLAILALGAFLL